MNVNQSKGTPQQYLTDVTTVEHNIEKAVIRSIGLTKDLGSEVATTLHKLLDLVKTHQNNLESHLPGLPSSPFTVSQRDNQVGYSSLADVFAVIGKATFEYSLLHTMAHRYYDSPEDGSTADLAEKHLLDYTHAINDINQVISEVFIRGQRKSGDECQCQCPGCSLGICLCAPHSTLAINEAWREAISPDAQSTICLRPPRRGSAVEIAGLSAGDTLLAVDGQEIKTNSDLQGAIRKHPPGEQIVLRVRRVSGETQEFSVVR
jgi:hypothetical protein